ncbi:MAG: Transcriptional regulatory protein YpdB [Flavobacteriaceae bacterium]|jgi:DNA-binding LytR/AlgR family response regulator|nr:MAG: Transcriptional regulatory protein YpdB [Flavobacteriaceae bacterium]|tara:strand:+ start:12593 stop:13303 length:711 start_codon:yes stop_codon:yes gene_type:complete
MSIKCLIIDDEPLAINVIKKYLTDINDIVIVETFNNAIDAINFLKDNHIDLIFLDINMPVFDGLNFIKSLEKKPLIVITTAYKEYAAETYELDVTDYLVKPISLPRFMKSINKVFNSLEKNKYLNQFSKKDRPFIFLRINKKKLQKVYLDEILVVESLKDYLKIFTTTERFIIHQTLSSFTDDLPKDKFIRIHRSFTISIDKVDSIEGNSVQIDGVRYVIGRTYIDKVKKIITSTK